MFGGIGLAATVYDPDGHCYIDAGELDRGVEVVNSKRERRVSRTATLDGGVATYDTGYAVADRTLIVKIPVPTSAQTVLFFHLAETYSEIIVTTGDGAFKGTPMRAWHDTDGALSLEIGITSQID
jgi:hypothetical protein